MSNETVGHVQRFVRLVLGVVVLFENGVVRHCMSVILVDNFEVVGTYKKEDRSEAFVGTERD